MTYRADTTKLPRNRPLPTDEGWKYESPADAAGPSLTTTSWSLGQVVTDVAEDVLQLAAKEDHGHDHGDSDNSNDESVLNETLALFLTKERNHPEASFPTRTRQPDAGWPVMKV